MEEAIFKKIDELAPAMVEAVLELVRIESVKSIAMDLAPFGMGIRKALDKALELSAKLGFDTIDLDGYMGYAQYGKGTDYICAIGHVDVVPAKDGWKQPPYSGYVEDDIIYSRGVLDNKGPILACLYGLYALKELELPLTKTVRILFGCDEESGFKDLEYYLSKEKPPVMGFTPDCKYPVVYGERGRAIIRVEASLETLPVFFDFVNYYFINAKNSGDRLGIDFSDKEYGTMEMRNYILAQEGEKVYLDVTLSYPTGIAIREILDRIQLKANDMKVTLLQNYNPVKFDKNSAFVQVLKDCYEAVTGLDGTPVTTTGGTYAKLMPNIVPFGPSFPGQKGIGHNPNEWMAIEDLITNAKIYALSLYQLCRLP